MTNEQKSSVPILLGASLMLSLSMGMRQCLGLFMGPVTRDLAMTASDYTLAIAVQNMAWGLTQPIVGAISDRIGIRVVTVIGALCFVAGMALAATAQSPLVLMLGIGPLIGVGLSCCGSAMAMTAGARAVPATRRSLVLGIVSAAGSVGTLVIAPSAQSIIGAGDGWRIGFIAFIALAALMVPMAFLAGRADRVPVRATEAGLPATIGAALRAAGSSRSFLVMTTAYFVCGLQLVFLTTHLPTYLAICGMDPTLGGEALSVIGGANVIGSYLFGWLGGRYPKHILLGLIYVLRSLAIAAFFAAPISPAAVLLFAAAMGTLWLGVVPLVSGLVAETFGVRFMAMLSGLAFMSHQVGSFLGAYGGGVIYERLGSYDRAWQTAAMIGVIAGLSQILFGGASRVTPEARLATA